MAVYPNPGNGFFRITSAAAIQEVTVLEASGRVLLRRRVSGAPNHFRLADMALPAGVYHLLVRTVAGVAHGWLVMGGRR